MGSVNWPPVKLGEYLRVKHGYAFKGKFFDADGPHVLLTPGSFNEEGGFRDQGDKTKRYTGDVPDGYVLNQGDLIVAMTEQAPGLLGSSALVPASDLYLHNQRLGRIVELDEGRLNRRFLYYLFNTRDVRQQIDATATGGKVRHTAPERIANVVFRCPPIQFQERIANALAAYDDLIDNDRRRIKLLEDSVRLLFDEWFVRLRFPGEVSARSGAGLPAVWSRLPLEEVLVLQRGFDLPSQDREAGDTPIYGSTGIVGFHDKAKVSGPGIVTGRSGTLGDVHFVWQDFWPLNTALWVKEFKRVTPLFALYLLRGMNLGQYNGGVSVPTLDRKVVHKAEVVLPPVPLMERFDAMAQDVHQQIDILTKMNAKLRAARDLLLPRLMSGELVV